MKGHANPKPTTRRRGNTLVLVGVTAPVLMGFAALTIDIGQMYSVRAELQNAMDAAALAGASALALDADLVRARAHGVAALNTVNGDPVMVPLGNIELGEWDTYSGTFTPLYGDQQVKADSVRISNTLQLTFAQIWGNTETEISASATVSFGTPDPWDVIIVQDTSGSFTDALDQAKEADRALVECLRDHINNASKIGLVQYTGTSRVAYPLTEIEDGLSGLLSAVDSLNQCCMSVNPNSCNGNPQCRTYTNIAAGVDAALNEFLADGIPYPGTTRAIVIISDGQPKAEPSSGLTDYEMGELAVTAVDNAWYEEISVFGVYYAGSSDTPGQDATFLEGLVRGEGTFAATPDAAELSTLVWDICASLPPVLVE